MEDLIALVYSESPRDLLQCSLEGFICRNSGSVSAWGKPHFQKVFSKVLIQLNEVLKKTSLQTEMGVSSQRVSISYTWL